MVFNSNQQLPSKKDAAENEKGGKTQAGKRKLRKVLASLAAAAVLTANIMGIGGCAMDSRRMDEPSQDAAADTANDSDTRRESGVDAGPDADETEMDADRVEDADLGPEADVEGLDADIVEDADLGPEADVEGLDADIVEDAEAEELDGDVEPDADSPCSTFTEGWLEEVPVGGDIVAGNVRVHLEGVVTMPLRITFDVLCDGSSVPLYDDEVLDLGMSTFPALNVGDGLVFVTASDIPGPDRARIFLDVTRMP